ncbi:hypothetical protein FEM48_Zijuj04G0154800 [Ziziphus jujuba var. spinosa]|uniref:Peptidase S9 prolyl oligopeptidase catalytic domain-containing protein n=1 Tax=Ziziphus jujuba var. spinosa TaxID=714518 RepID=A0A978VKN7_ZIZJJ|nr:hypothetical protein FEM48_Zijuj04G0154800 [Ziziphus jujuba var. spinosa]
MRRGFILTRIAVHGTADEIVPVEDAYEFAKIIPNHKLHIIKKAGHRYTNKHRAEFASVVLEFIKSCLQQDKAASSQTIFSSLPY